MGRYNLKPYRWYFITIVLLGLGLGFWIPFFFNWKALTNVSAAERTEHDLLILGDKIEEFRKDYGKLPYRTPFLKFTAAIKPLEEMGGDDLTTYFPGNADIPGLTTPVAYVNDVWPDYFSDTSHFPIGYYHDGTDWLLFSMGPDRDYDIDPAAIFNLPKEERTAALEKLTYKPENGAWSNGDIWRLGE